MKGKSTGTLLFLLLLGSSFTAVRAQKAEYGLFGGISIPNLTSGSGNNPLNSGYSSRFGPDFGLINEVHLTRLFSIEGRIEYSAQGGKKNGLQAFPTPPETAQYFEMQGMEAPPYLYANYKSEARINYLRLLPVMPKLGWDLGRQSPFRFSVSAGPFLGILLSAKQVTKGSSEVYADPGGQQALPGGAQSFDASTNIRDQLHKANFGIDGNIELAYLFGADRMHKIFLKAGGNYGFIKIQKNTDDGKNNTGAATVLLGYTYGFDVHKMYMKKRA
jgi:hypothetical protein